MRKKFQKLFFTGLIVCMVMTGITGCKSPSDKEENTKEEQQDSEQQERMLQYAKCGADGAERAADTWNAERQTGRRVSASKEQYCTSGFRRDVALQSAYERDDYAGCRRDRNFRRAAVYFL